MNGPPMIEINIIVFNFIKIFYANLYNSLANTLVQIDTKLFNSANLEKKILPSLFIDINQ